VNGENAPVAAVSEIGWEHSGSSALAVVRCRRRAGVPFKPSARRHDSTEFEADGERVVLDTICHGPGIYPDPKRSFALRWLREREVERARQEQKMRSYVRYTFWAAVAAMATGIVAMLVAWFAR
jgi:hypothetical protein